MCWLLREIVDHEWMGLSVIRWLDDLHHSSKCGGVPSIGLPVLWLHSPSFHDQQLHAAISTCHLWCCVFFRDSRCSKCTQFAAALQHMNVKWPHLQLLFFSGKLDKQDSVRKKSACVFCLVLAMCISNVFPWKSDWLCDTSCGNSVFKKVSLVASN